MNYLANPKPTYGPDRKKYELAKAVWDYVDYLAGRQVVISDIYTTNLCNEFLDHQPGSGTVLIPEDKAQKGIEEISKAVESSRFQVILSMPVQPFYYLCKFGFIDERNELINAFVLNAAPKSQKAAQGLYVQTGKAQFLLVCGQVFHHCGIPVIPILHVKQWPLKRSMIAYTQAMDTAKRQISEILTK